MGRIHRDWGSIPLPKSIMVLLIFFSIVFFLNFFQFILRAFDLVGVYVVKVLFMNNQNCGKLNCNFHHFPCTSI